MSTLIWQEVGELQDIPVRGSRRFKHEEQTIALFRTAENTVYAINDSCPHEGGPLSEGIVHGNCVTCPLHNWVISLDTGTAQGADCGATKTYPVRQEGTSVFVALTQQTT